MFLVLREAGKVYEGIAAWLPWVVVRLDEGIETFERLFEHGSRIKDNRALSVVVSKEFGTLLSPNFPVVAAQALHERIIGVSPPPEVIVLGREEMPALGEFIDASQYTGGRLILSWIGAFQRGDLLYAGGNARFELIDGSQISHYQLSFGEKRLLAFLIKLYACPSTIIVDELANGMHHGWIERAVELMDDFGTQAFLTSQDPLLIDGIPLSEDSYPTRNTVVLCEIAESGRLRWRNMTSDEAEDFFESLAVGLQHVSEIMRSKGLW